MKKEVFPAAVGADHGEQGAVRYLQGDAGKGVEAPEPQREAFRRQQGHYGALPRDGARRPGETADGAGGRTGSPVEPETGLRPYALGPEDHYQHQHRPKTSRRALANWRKTSGLAMTTPAPNSAPQMLPIPPMATAMTTSKDSLKPKLGGAMAIKAAP